MKKALSIILSLVCLISGLWAIPSYAAETKTTRQIDNAEGYFSSWAETGAARGFDRKDYMEGDGCYSFSGSDMNIVCNLNGVSCPGGIKNERYFEFWFYIDNASLLSPDSGIFFYKDDKTYYRTSKIPFANLKDGWNKIDVSLLLASASLDELNKIEFHLVTADTATVKIDDLSFTYTKEVKDRSALDAQLELAKAFDSSALSNTNKEKLERLINRAESDVKTQRDAEALAADIKNTMETKKTSNKFDDILTTHGRTFYRDDELHMNYSASGFTVRFYGTRLTAKMNAFQHQYGYWDSNNHSYINIYIDNDRKMYDFDTDYATDDTASAKAALADYNARCPHLLIDHDDEYVLADGLEEGVHTVTILKRNEVVLNNEIVMSEISTDGKFLTPPKKSTRRIEVIGDSNITAFGNMALHEGYTAETQDATISFASYIADAFGAEYTITARCGAYTEPVPQPNTRQPEFFTNTYFYTDYWNNGDANFDENNPAEMSFITPEKLYDFTEADHDVVVVHMGDNDVWGKRDTQENREHFVEIMKNFLKQVRLANPDALIIYTFSMNMSSYRDWTKQAADAVIADGDSNLCYVDLNNCDTNGGSGHPSMKVHKAAAQEVVEKIEELLGWQGTMREVYADPTMETGEIYLSDDYAVPGKKVSFTTSGKAKNIKITSHGEEIKFAEENGVYSFAMPEGSVMISGDIEDAPAVKYGDLDGDKKVSTSDALLALQIAVGKVVPTSEQKITGNVDGSGDIASSDALLILQKAVNKIDKFPVESEG